MKKQRAIWLRKVAKFYVANLVDPRKVIPEATNNLYKRFKKDWQTPNGRKAIQAVADFAGPDLEKYK